MIKKSMLGALLFIVTSTFSSQELIDWKTLNEKYTSADDFVLAEEVVSEKEQRRRLRSFYAKEEAREKKEAMEKALAGKKAAERQQLEQQRYQQNMAESYIKQTPLKKNARVNVEQSPSKRHRKDRTAEQVVEEYQKRLPAKEVSRAKRTASLNQRLNQPEPESLASWHQQQHKTRAMANTPANLLNEFAGIIVEAFYGQNDMTPERVYQWLHSFNKNEALYYRFNNNPDIRDMLLHHPVISALFDIVLCKKCGIERDPKCRKMHIAKSKFSLGHKKDESNKTYKQLYEEKRQQGLVTDNVNDIRRKLHAEPLGAFVTSAMIDKCAIYFAQRAGNVEYLAAVDALSGDEDF